MKVLIDAHLPRRAVGWFVAAGCDVIHTLDLPDQNRTPDDQIIAVAEQDGRVVMTKDEDFVDRHLLSGRPPKLLLVSTGNINNRDLESLLVPLIPTLIAEFQTNSFLELGRAGIVILG